MDTSRLNNKRVIVCSVQVPYTEGGAELLIKSLILNLRGHGYLVEEVKLPFSFWPQWRVLIDCFLWRITEIKDIMGRRPDVVIATKFPAYFVRHPNKVLWLCHQHRSVYDCFGTRYGDCKNTFYNRVYAKLIKKLDDLMLNEVRKIFTISRNVSKRLKRFNNIDSETLYVPLVSKKPEPGAYGDYILFVSRLTVAKRADLFIEALAKTDGDVKAVVVGEGDQLPMLREKAEKLELDSRVSFKGFVPEKELCEYYSNAFAVFFGPYDEDYGLVTLEAFTAKKPVITCKDSGGPTEFVEDNVNGFVCDPSPEEIARKIDYLYAHKDKCLEFGSRGYEKVRDITWDKVINSLEQYF